MSCSRGSRASCSTRSSSSPGGSGSRLIERGHLAAHHVLDQIARWSVRQRAGVDGCAVAQDRHAVADGAQFLQAVGDVNHAHARARAVCRRCGRLPGSRRPDSEDVGSSKISRLEPCWMARQISTSCLPAGLSFSTRQSALQREVVLLDERRARRSISPPVDPAETEPLGAGPGRYSRRPSDAARAATPGAPSRCPAPRPRPAA